MRLPLSTLPLPLTLVLLTATAALPAPASVTSSSPLSLAQPFGFIKPRFLPPADYRQQKRQDGASSGQGGLTVIAAATSEADAGTGGGDTAQTSAAAVTTTEAAPTATQELPQTTTQAQETASQPEPTTTQVQTTSQAQQTTPAQTTDAQATTTSQAPPSAATSTTSAAQVPPSSTSSSSGAQVSTTPTPTTSGLSAASSAQSSSVGSKSSISNVEITFTSLFTASDGSVQTSTGTTTTPSAVPIKKDGGGSSTGKTWGIIGGVVGGVVVVGLGVFVIYRMTQRRFSSLDNDELDEIKWPELVSSGQEVSGNTSTLRPLDTHRTGGAGIGDDGASEYGGPAGAGDMGVARIYGAVGHGRGESQSTLLDGPGGGMTHSRQASYEQLAMADSGGAYGPGAAGGGGHYDPFLGPAAYPPLHASQAQGMVYPPPHYLAGAPGSHSSHERSPSLRSQPAGAAASDGYGSPNTQEYLSRNPTMASTKFGSVYGTSGSVMGSEPRGAPGAGGAMSRATSPPVGSRSEGVFRVPSPQFGTEEGLGFALDEKEMEGRRGPL